MRMESTGWTQLAIFVGLLLVVTKPLGIYLVRVLDAGGRTFLDPVMKPFERLLAYLDATHRAYDLTTDLGLIDGVGPQLSGHRAVVLAGRPVRMNWLAAAGLTAIAETVPVTEDAAVSVAVSDWLPAVLSVTVNVCEPASAAVNV